MPNQHAENANIDHASPSAEEILYYADGYHGGIKGHMPLGAWRDIMNTLDAEPEWKISIDIEPISWAVLRQRDPQTYRRLESHLAAPPDQSRTEMVAASYAQPYGWVIGGESNIRHITRGLEIIHEHFPNLLVDTYAVQEPCWTSSMPQILLSLGFQRAVLKNPSTAWCGYAAGFDADIVYWVGPDGSRIPTIPRYACERTQKTYETESAEGKPEFAQKCRQHGIQFPAGMYYQDCGWPAKPRVRGPHIRYITWRQFTSDILPPPQQEWRFSQEDILCTIPWGHRLVQRLAREVRVAENTLLVTEKLAAIAWALGGRPWPAEALQKAWDQTLMAQHHDAWICSSRDTGRPGWAWGVSAQTWVSDETCKEILCDATQAIARADQPQPQPGLPGICLINPLSHDRDDIARVLITADRGTRSLRVRDEQGRTVPSQIVPTRAYPDDASFNAGKLLFRAQVPALGYAHYHVEALDESDPIEDGATARLIDNDRLEIQTDLYQATLDLNRGGAFTSLISKAEDIEIIDQENERSFHEIRGYFIEKEAWLSTADTRAEAQIVENGPVRVRIHLSGLLADNPYHIFITFHQGEPRIDFHTRLLFQSNTYIGDPVQLKAEERFSNPRKSNHNSRYKLQAIFPFALRNPALFKDAAYDVCRSRNADTTFETWDTIKHNVLLNWVDLVDEKANRGATLFADHTTEYTFAPDAPLGLTLAWAWDGGFWWHKMPAQGIQEAEYAILPHPGSWDTGHVSSACMRWCEPLQSQLTEAQHPMPSASLLSISGEGIQVPTLLVDGDDLLVRLFNAEGDDSPRQVRLNLPAQSVELVELDGRTISQIQSINSQPGTCAVQIAMPRFGLRTLRFRNVKR